MEKKCDALARVYSLHDEYTRGHGAVCEQGCASCCTCNVTMTSLEYAFMVDGMDERERAGLEQRVTQGRTAPRFQPMHTINNMALLCIEGKEIPEEENDPSWGQCPLLDQGSCTIYEKRPLGCRMLFSQVKCRDAGYARMPPYVLTLNNLFQQVVEHMDARGTSGNLTDMILWQAKSEMADSLPNPPAYILKNYRAPVFMVPPEHQDQIRPLMVKLSRLMEDVCAHFP
ncbi:Putative zinc-or iron-chelating domain-containing protein [Desulfocicer vacuolatum DSM 3385]|uniref:Putative zinc-or iron-chelating domain-containing protein n=1 Tax=Desulfocicer vacuolatum DSM 3385 TaxID=1121400 RepID=A0A1W1ZUX5_9BACT|nr:YkgJ family cysteine cluster protein [Desulfocicer vacuolatum]SMC52197.1 Putative zinc-or iron-chelating domain-containing protein [Desulfocicer vacuolatum DSM 3385]